MPWGRYATAAVPNMSGASPSVAVSRSICHTGVGLLQFVEAEDEFYPRGPVQAGAVLLEVIEDGSDRDAGVERPRDAQLLDPHQFGVGQDEVSRPYLNRANTALVGRPGCSAIIHPSHLGETVVLEEPFNV